jgi:hypothetical protein
MHPGSILPSATEDLLDTEDPRKTTCAEIVGGLLYLATHKLPDIAFAMGVLSRHMVQPSNQHFLAAK